jgi:hypothetical protein
LVPTTIYRDGGELLGGTQQKSIASWREGTHVSVSGQERAADCVPAIHRPHALGRLDVPQLERAVTCRGDELVVGRHGETAHVGPMTREVERQEFDRFDGGGFGRSRRR